MTFYPWNLTNYSQWQGTLFSQGVKLRRENHSSLMGSTIKEWTISNSVTENFSTLINLILSLIFVFINHYIHFNVCFPHLHMLKDRLLMKDVRPFFSFNCAFTDFPFSQVASGCLVTCFPWSPLGENTANVLHLLGQVPS